MSSQTKRNFSSSFSPSPGKTKKKPNAQQTPKGAAGAVQRNNIRPLYPTQQDKKELTNVVEHFTKLAMEPDMEDVRMANDFEYSPGEGLATKLEESKATIITGLENTLTQQMINESTGGADFDINNAAAISSEYVLSITTQILQIGEDDEFKQVVTKMSDYVRKAITVELQACNVMPMNADSTQTLDMKKTFLQCSNPLRSMITNIVNNMLAEGVEDKPSIVRGAGLIANLNSTHHIFHNKVAATERKLDLATNQLAKLTCTITDQDNSESHRMLVIRGISEAINTKEAPGPQNRSIREHEARTYINSIIGFNGPFSVSIPPSRNRGPGLCILTTAFEQDKFKLERLISTLRSNGGTNISSKRWTPADKSFSNLPEPSELSTMLKMAMKNKLKEQLIHLRSIDDENQELADHIENTFGEAIHNHDYLPRKVLYGKENSVQYEFLCPVSTAVMMTYKGARTFDGYDFTQSQPNPRVRELARNNPELAEKHWF